MSLKAIASELRSSGVRCRVVIAGDEEVTEKNFKITCKTKLPAGLDHGILSQYEDKALRGRTSFDDITTAKLVNSYKKAVINTITPVQHRMSGIESKQEKHTQTVLVCRQFGKSLNVPDIQKLRYDVVLVNAHGKPVYTKADLTTKLELKLTERPFPAKDAQEA